MCLSHERNIRNCNPKIFKLMSDTRPDQVEPAPGTQGFIIIMPAYTDWLFQSVFQCSFLGHSAVSLFSEEIQTNISSALPPPVTEEIRQVVVPTEEVVEPTEEVEIEPKADEGESKEPDDPDDHSSFQRFIQMQTCTFDLTVLTPITEIWRMVDRSGLFDDAPECPSFPVFNQYNSC